jgi:zinc transport system substrate-binding protein
MSMCRSLPPLLLAVCLAMAVPQAATAEPLKVAVTIAPVHSLTAAVMDGLGEPKLLVRAGSSEHSYSMRPSDARALNEAQIVIRVSDRLETFLNKPIAALSRQATIVTLADSPGLTLFPPREGGTFEAHVHRHEGHAHGGGKGKHGHDADGHDEDERGGDGHEDAEIDPHVWLDPGNAAIIADRIAAELGQARPEEAAAYKANAEKLKEKLAALDVELKGELAGLGSASFIVFHDAYHYFEARYGVKAAGSITVSPERQPGAARLKAIRAKIAEAASACVFSEPQFEPKLVARLIEGTKAKSGTLDGLGANLPEGPDLYFAMMRGLATSLKGCLG